MSPGCSKRVWLAGWLAATGGLWAPSVMTHAAEGAPEVLILNSYHPGFLWTEHQLDGLLGTLRVMKPHLEPRVEYMDWKRVPTEENRDALCTLFQHRYAGRDLALVVATDNAALDFTLRFRAELFSNAPVVVSGISGYQDLKSTWPPDVTGVVESIDPAGTIQSIRRLLPETREVVFILDGTESSQALHGEVQAVLPPFEAQGLTFRFLESLSLKQVREHLAVMAPGSVVFMLAFNRDPDGAVFGHEESLALVVQASAVPVFHAWEWALGRGIVGGNLLNGRMHGIEAGMLAVRILEGEDPSTIPVITDSHNPPMFDVKELERWGIPLDAVPEGSVLINVPDSFLRQHKGLVAGGAVTLVVLGMFNLVLLINIRRRRRAEQALRLSEARLRAIFTAADPVALVVTDLEQDARILEFSPGAERTFGYTAAEVLGRSIVNLQPLHSGVPYAQVLERLRRGKPGFSGQVSMRRKNGQEFPAIFSLTPVVNENGLALAALGVTVDITDRMRAEEALRSSEERFAHALEATRDGLWDWNVRTGEVYFSPSYYRMLGYEPGGFPATFASWQGAVHPDHAERAARVVQEIRERTRDSFEGETRMRMRDGSWLWILGRGKVVQKAPDGTPLRVVGTHVDLTDQKRVEEALRKSEEDLRTTLQSIGEAVVATDAEGRVTRLNPVAERLTGWSAQEALGRPLLEVVLLLDEVTRAPLESSLHCVMTGEKDHHRRGLLKSRQGQERQVAESGAPIFDRQGAPVGVVLVIRDVTEQRRLEEQLRQAQKMEAVGRLAGGVAHDFNNLLTPILGYTEMVLESLAPQDSRRDQLVQVNKAATRAKELTRELLAFSRKQVIEMRVLDMGPVVTGFHKMLRRTIRENIDIHVHVSADLWMVRADSAQLEQILMNLAINAQDAMPDGGTMRIEVDNVVVPLEDPSTGTHSGAHVQLKFSDTGVGMTQDVVEHLFEPFFTTKAKGQGTGLGLATVYGIVKQHEGSILVDSQPGKGTTFTVYLPRVEGEAEPECAPVAKNHDGMGWETVLVVEDNDMVRALACSILGAHGYRTLSASSGAECLALLHAYHGPIHLLLTDVVMPQMNGRELYFRVARVRPKVRVLYMSGYTDNVMAEHGVLEAGVQLLNKPFSANALVRKVRQVLDGQHAAVG